MKKTIIASAILLVGCVAQAPPPPHRVYIQPTQQPPMAPLVYEAPVPQPVVSVYVDPPLVQPPPIRVEWAPPPMLVETPPPLPYDGAVWTGGYWVWEGNWVWAHGRWAPPPRPGYNWVNPYYEHRGGSVVFVNGFWAAPGVSFVAPSLSINIALGAVGIGVIAGPRPIGPEGVFLPPPPGSHMGLIVPAPIGTAPAVLTSAPPIIHGGMHITTVNNNNSNNVTNNINNNVTNNITHVTNVTNVTVIAPASATANGQAVNSLVPAQAHLAAGMHPVVKAFAPEPASSKPIPAYMPGRPAINLPPAQMVRPEITPGSMQTRMPTPPLSSQKAGQIPAQIPGSVQPGIPQHSVPPMSPARTGPAEVPAFHTQPTIPATPQPWSHAPAPNGLKPSGIEESVVPNQDRQNQQRPKSIPHPTPNPMQGVQEEKYGQPSAPAINPENFRQKPAMSQTQTTPQNVAPANIRQQPRPHNDSEPGQDPHKSKQEVKPVQRHEHSNDPEHKREHEHE